MLSLDGDACMGESEHCSGSVGIVPDQTAIFIDNRIDCITQSGFCGNVVQVLYDSRLVRHGDVGSTHLQGTHGTDRICKRCLIDLKGKIDIVHSKLLKGSIVHER